MHVNLTCSVCGASFSRPAWQAKKYPDACCSKACGYAARRSRGIPAPIIDGDTARIPLCGRGGVIRGYALVDAADAAWLGQWKWHISHYNGVGRCELVDGKPETFLMHRELLGLSHSDKVEVDHISRDRRDNRRANLRITPKHVHSQNVPSVRGAVSAHRGVTFKKATGKWVAQIHADGKMRHLGTFLTEEEAAEAAREARLKLLPFAVD